MTTFMFPGQGSQFCGMGEHLFSEFPELVACADSVLGYSIKALCLEDSNKQLDKTNYTQPALYTVNVLSYLQKIKEQEQQPDYLIGHSLGEYSALFAAGVFDFETGLRLVQKRGQLMSQETNGSMAAVIGLSGEQVEALINNNHLQQQVSIANYNSYSQIVLSGASEGIAAMEPLALAAGATYFIPLRVSGAFHSPYMQTAQTHFHEFLTGFNFSPAKIPVLANINAKPYQANETSNNLSAQITHPVLWRQSIEYLLNAGEVNFEEIGPGKVLSGILNRIKRKL